MKAVIQRVSKAEVRVDGNITGKITKGLLILLGVHVSDSEQDVDWMVKKIANLRIFQDENDKMNLSTLDVKGEILVVSQFTLYGDAQKGNRPSFIGSAKPDISEPLYESFCFKMSETIGKQFQKGIFGAMMEVDFINDGPVTIILESKKI